MSRKLAEGIYIQPYREAIRGATAAAKRTNIKQNVAALSAVGVRGIAWHGRSVELGAAMPDLIAIGQEAGLLNVAAFGMDDSEPGPKGTRIGHVANAPGVDAVIFNCEGAWEDEDNDKAKAAEMGRCFRAVAPTAIAVDQSWPLPTVHWSKFPWIEFNTFIDQNFPQYYMNNWTAQYGRDRCKVLVPKFDAAWVKLEDKLLRPANKLRPRGWTIQGYGWADIFSDLVFYLTSQPTLIVWCDPWPEKSFMLGLKCSYLFKRAGFSGSNAVGNFQAANGLGSDNRCGPKTMAKLGIGPQEISAAGLRS